MSEGVCGGANFTEAVMDVIDEIAMTIPIGAGLCSTDVLSLVCSKPIVLHMALKAQHLLLFSQLTKHRGAEVVFTGEEDFA